MAITLWCLATQCENRTIGHLFGVARCTVYVIVHETVAAVNKSLLRTYTSFSTGQQLVDVVNGFETQ